MASSRLTAVPKLSYIGCGDIRQGFLSLSDLRSSYTDFDMAMKASMLLTKYLDSILSPGRCSCGIMLSSMDTTLVFPLPFTMRAIVPKHGAMSGSQNLMMSRSAFFFFSSRPTFIQLNGFMELTLRFMSRSSGRGSGEYCVLPGKRKEGYCRVKVNISTSSPFLMYSLAILSSKSAMPPLYGHAGPTISIFITVFLL